MNRPNIAMDAPPTQIEVGGNLYDVNVDYPVWIEVCEKLGELWHDNEHIIENLDITFQIEMMVFGGRIDESPFEALQAVIEFAGGYPEDKIESDEDSARIVDFSHDINAIVVAIRNQSGIDISYKRTEPFHWWLFLNEFKCLAGDHWITRLMQIRAYDGDDKDQLKLKRRYALPEKVSKEEQAVADELDRLLGD